MTTIGIDIGGRMHAVARCREGQSRADREVLRVSQDRAGFAMFDAWLGRLRTEVKRSAAVLKDARYLCQSELPIATTIMEARIRQGESRAAASAQPVPVR